MAIASRRGSGIRTNRLRESFTFMGLSVTGAGIYAWDDISRATDLKFIFSIVAGRV